jgi:transcriptional regulator with XRE-family HTH domain
MSRKPQKNYLKTYRLRAALTLEELGALLGVHKATLQRYEAGAWLPAEIVIASELIFGVSAANIFPALYNGVDEDVPIRALALNNKLTGREDRASLKKLALISGIPDRLR